MFQSLYKYILCAANIALVWVSAFMIASSNFSSWSNVAYQDVAAAYAQLKNNHPGYHDTENPQWKDMLESEYGKHLSKTSQIASYDEYKALMKSFVRSMNDVHMGVQFVDPDMTIAPRFSEKASIAEFLPQCVWIRLPSFDCKSAEEVASIKDAIEKIAEYRNYKAIVFDVRGNSGGSSEWGNQLLKNLFSEQCVDQKMEAIAQKNPVYVEWRASKDNIAYMNSWITPENIIALNLRDIAHLIKATIDGCQLALGNNEPFFKEAAELHEYKTTKEVMVNRVTAKIILLTDGQCVSSCLDFADTLFAIAPVMHMGHATNADTAYMECRSVTLPSNKVSLTFPIKVYRNRIRKPYQKYYPEHVYAGDINDTQALQNWVISLM